MIKPSVRLLTVAGMVPRCKCVCDVGTDHGYLPIYLVSNDICEHAYALDVRTGPLSRAREHVREAGLSDRIDVRLSDGLLALMNESGIDLPNVIVTAGMGGPLMERILTEGRDVAIGSKTLILSPQSHVKEFRRFLLNTGYQINDEQMVCEDGKYYFIMKVIPKAADSEKIQNPQTAAESLNTTELKDNRTMKSEAALTYGAPLIARRDPVLMSYIDTELERLFKVRESLEKTGTSKSRLSEIEREISIAEWVRNG